MAEPGEMSGSQRAAILLMSLGEEDATSVLKFMDAREVQKVGSAMASLPNVSRDELDAVIDSFVTVLSDQTPLGIGTEDYIRRILTRAVGPRKAAVLLDRILHEDGKSAGLDALQWMETRAIAEMVSQEHPQIIAIVLSHLDSDPAAEILGGLGEELRKEVIMRIATLDDIQESALNELNALVSDRNEQGGSSRSATVGGLKVAADIINAMDSTEEESIMDFFRESDETMSQKIEDMMFSFDMLMKVDDRGIQTLLRDVQSDVLTIALKGADRAIQDKIFGNMSKRAAEMLRDDLDARGPVRLSDVEEAQKEILTVARRLAEEGTIMLSSKGEEFV